MVTAGSNLAQAQAGLNPTGVKITELTFAASDALVGQRGGGSLCGVGGAGQDLQQNVCGNA